MDPSLRVREQPIISPMLHNENRTRSAEEMDELRNEVRISAPSAGCPEYGFEFRLKRSANRINLDPFQVHFSIRGK